MSDSGLSWRPGSEPPRGDLDRALVCRDPAWAGSGPAEVGCFRAGVWYVERGGGHEACLVDLWVPWPCHPGTPPAPPRPRLRRVVAVEDAGPPSLFLAGGITGCPDWQAEMLGALEGLDLVAFNPRRPRFDVSDPYATDAQIRWERDQLRRADAVSFWFCGETLCPIVLFELGAHLHDPKPVFVGCHPGYARRADVAIQSALARPGIEVVDSVAALAAQVRRWAAGDG